MSDEAVTPGGTVLDDLVYLVEDRIENKRAEERSILVSYILDKLGISALGSDAVRRVVLTVLANVAARARSEANSRLKGIDEDRQSTDEAFKAAAAGELLGIKYDESEFVHVRDRHCKAENQTWEAVKKKPDNSSSPGRVRQLRAGIWIGQSYKSAQQKRRTLLQSFEATLTAYLTSPDALVQEEIAKLRASAVGASKLSRMSETGSDTAKYLQDHPHVISTHPTTMEALVPAELDHQSEARSPGLSVNRGASSRFNRRITTYLRRHRILVLSKMRFAVTDDSPKGGSTKIIVKFVLTSTLGVSIIIMAMYMAPPFTLQPFRSMDDLGALVIIMWLALCPIATMLYCEFKLFRKVVPPVFMSLVFALLGVRSMNYDYDTTELRTIEILKPAGTLLGPLNFGKSGDCPTEVKPDKFSLLPLSSCVSKDGLVRAEMESRQGLRIGGYPADNTRFEAAAKSGHQFGYYVDTRFRADTGSLSTCGIAVETNKGLLLFRLLWDISSGQYIADVSSVKSSSSPTQVGLAPLIKSATLPFVIERGWPRVYRTWTRLTVFIQSDWLVAIVDDRTTIRTSIYSGVTDIYGSSLAIVAGSDANGGIASCIFDRAEVGTIPTD